MKHEPLLKPLTWRDALCPQEGATLQQAAECSELEPPATDKLTDAQREILVRQSLTRFVRNKTAPSELEDLRYNLIVARVLSGMTAVVASEKFGYANSTQLSLIESGQRKTPSDWKFIKQASQVYSVSTDFLLGLTPHTEIDGKLARQFDLMRRTEEIVGGVAAQIATAMIESAREDEITTSECERLSAAAQRIDETLARLRNKHGFDDLPGGAPLVAAVDAMNDAAEPVRRRIRNRRALEDYLSDALAGRLPVIEHLTMRYRAELARADALS